MCVCVCVLALTPCVIVWQRGLGVLLRDLIIPDPCHWVWWGALTSQACLWHAEPYLSHTRAFAHTYVLMNTHTQAHTRDRQTWVQKCIDTTHNLTQAHRQTWAHTYTLELNDLLCSQTVPLALKNLIQDWSNFSHWLRRHSNVQPQTMENLHSVTAVDYISKYMTLL